MHAIIISILILNYLNVKNKSKVKVINLENAERVRTLLLKWAIFNTRQNFWKLFSDLLELKNVLEKAFYSHGLSRKDGR